MKKNFFSDFINFSKSVLQELKEKHIPKDTILAKNHFTTFHFVQSFFIADILCSATKKELPKFGFTDASLLEVAKGNKLLLTDDMLLFYYYKNNRIPSMSLSAIKTNPKFKI